MGMRWREKELEELEELGKREYKRERGEGGGVVDKL
jgi:hypothetical protein